MITEKEAVRISCFPANLFTKSFGSVFHDSWLISGCIQQFIDTANNAVAEGSAALRRFMDIYG